MQGTSIGRIGSLSFRGIGLFSRRQQRPDLVGGTFKTTSTRSCLCRPTPCQQGAKITSLAAPIQRNKSKKNSKKKSKPLSSAGQKKKKPKLQLSSNLQSSATVEPRQQPLSEQVLQWNQKQEQQPHGSLHHLPYAPVLLPRGPPPSLNESELYENFALLLDEILLETTQIINSGPGTHGSDHVKRREVLTAELEEIRYDYDNYQNHTHNPQQPLSVLSQLTAAELKSGLMHWRQLQQTPQQAIHWAQNDDSEHQQMNDFPIPSLETLLQPKDELRLDDEQQNPNPFLTRAEMASLITNQLNSQLESFQEFLIKAASTDHGEVAHRALLSALDCLDSAGASPLWRKRNDIVFQGTFSSNTISTRGGSMLPTLPEALTRFRGQAIVGVGSHNGDKEYLAVLDDDAPFLKNRVISYVQCWMGQCHPATKRVMALPGDIVEMEMIIGDEQASTYKRAVQIPPGHFWAVGDNRSESLDSRTYGAVPLSNVRFVLDDPLVEDGEDGNNRSSVNHEKWVELMDDFWDRLQKRVF